MYLPRIAPIPAAISSIGGEQTRLVAVVAASYRTRLGDVGSP